MNGRFCWLAPTCLWELAAPLLPWFAHRPQGGGTAATDEEAVFAAVVYVLVTGCPWRQLPSVFTVSWQTAYRRFRRWTRAGVWRDLHRSAVQQAYAPSVVYWARRVLEFAEARTTSREGPPHSPFNSSRRYF
ncbi:transposase [Allosalinactinospora lopnorensis]|uniref:transposase n=1 Tax=Allosalinactinospora lopnorensis TaxID=1352348 RepID=UPI00138EE770|nr:transposase [Allosalinactinospora lopnorensis]